MKRMTAVVLLAACMVFGSAFAYSAAYTPRAKQDSTAAMSKKHSKHMAAKAGKKSSKKTSMKKHPKKEKKEKTESEEKGGM